MQLTKTIAQVSPSRFRIRFPRFAAIIAPMFLASCATMISHPTPSPSWTERTGQVKLSSADASIVGDIVIRHDADNFVAEISKGPGLPLLKLSASFGTGAGGSREMLAVRATGPLARGGWTLKPESVGDGMNPNAKIHSRPWAALPEVFQWGEAVAKGGKFEVRLPDITMRAKTAHGRVQGFEYQIRDNPSRLVLDDGELAKRAALESVVCILDR
ncbi:MAG: hypothetical protein ABMA01_15510 [Chthoniobacteraceae bacterium]